MIEDNNYAAIHYSIVSLLKEEEREKKE